MSEQTPPPPPVIWELVLPCMPDTDECRKVIANLAMTCKVVFNIARDDMRRRTWAMANLAFATMAENNKDNAIQLVLAGSLALWLKEPSNRWFPHDADLFCYGDFGTNAKTQIVAAGNIYEFVTKSPCEVVCLDGRLQLILSNYYASVQEVIESSDLTCCRIAATKPEVFETAKDFFCTKTFYAITRAGHIGDYGAETYGLTQSEYKRYLHRRGFYNCQRRRTLQRAMKYVRRGLKLNKKRLWAPDAVYKMGALYANTLCTTFVHRLSRGPTAQGWRVYFSCSCTHHPDDTELLWGDEMNVGGGASAIGVAGTPHTCKRVANVRPIDHDHIGGVVYETDGAFGAFFFL